MSGIYRACVTVTPTRNTKPTPSSKSNQNLGQTTEKETDEKDTGITEFNPRRITGYMPPVNPSNIISKVELERYKWNT
jgi:hypothetical protein